MSPPATTTTVKLPGPVQKPSRSKIRPTSASACVQTHPSYNTTSLLHQFQDIPELLKPERPATAANSVSEQPTKRPVTHSGPSTAWKDISPKDADQKERKHRRPTIDRDINIEKVPDIDEEIYIKTEEGFKKEKIEDKLGIQVLDELKKLFKENEDYRNDGRPGLLNQHEFEGLFEKQMNLPRDRIQDVRALFQKIDWNNSGFISWDAFCTYMQLEFEEKEETYNRAREVAFILPARDVVTPHRESVMRITSNTDGSFISGSPDSCFSFWTPQLEQKRLKYAVISDQKKKSITDFMIMSEFNKIIMSTADREIAFVELSSFEPYCKITNLETVPLILDYSCKKENPDECLLLWGDRSGCVNIIWFQATGECLRTWKKNPRSEGIAVVGMDAVLRNPSIKFLRWKVHDDWIQSLKYYDSIRQVITCSNSEKTALVIGCTDGSTHVEEQLKETGKANTGAAAAPAPAAQGTSSTNVTVAANAAAANNAVAAREAAAAIAAAVQARHRLDADHTIFRIYKGVKTFDFSKSKNLLVTGGMDRIIRIWNPYVNTKPTGMLRGHRSPISYLLIAEDENRLFSIDEKKSILVWDIHDHNCLLTIRPKSHSVRGQLLASHYSQISKTLLMATTDHMAALNVKMNEAAAQLTLDEKHKDMTCYAGHYFGTFIPSGIIDNTKDEAPVLQSDIVLTHKEGVTCCKYNDTFKQVITCSENSVVKVWDMETGAAVFEFSKAHGEAAITCLSFDISGRRLITGGRDGAINIWNYNNGHNLRELRKEGEDQYKEVTSVQYVELSRNRFIVAVGWDRRINLFIDSVGESIHHVQYPQPKWPDDVANGHDEDILCLSFCPPNLLATSSYNGKVIVWNMVSGHVFCAFVAPDCDEYEDDSLDGDMSVAKLVFIPSRYGLKDAASLISSGPRGFLHFWNIYHGGRLLSRFQAYPTRGHMVSGMALNKSEQLLVTGDCFGFASVWKIDGYCLEGAEENCPELLHRWRAHTEFITSIDFLPRFNHLITSSNDSTCRMWSRKGEYIGTFGQPEPWSILEHERDTWQHPMVPYDVLVDPSSLPQHPTIRQRENTNTIIHQDSKTASDEEDTPQVSYYQRQQFNVDDETIAEQIKSQNYKAGTGKRLRHERQKPLRVDRGGPSEYRMLHWYPLQEDPPVDEPNVIRNKRDDSFMS